MPDVPSKEQLAEQTLAQSGYGWGAGLGILYANGGCADNPLAFPRYEHLYTRSYWTQRWMLKHPRVWEVRGIRNAPIEGSIWDYKKRDKDVPDERVELVRRNFDPLRHRYVKDALHGADYGWAPFEPIWDVAGGEWRLTELKPLLCDSTTIITDKSGRFTGLAQGDVGALTAIDASGAAVQALPAPFKALVFTYNRECGNLHGDPWLEHIRETAWKDWLDTAQQLVKLGGKLAGTQAVVKSPPDKKDASIALIKALANGAPGLWIPSLALAVDPKGNTDLWELVVKLSKEALTQVEVLDFGSTTDAIAGLLDRLRHDEELMYAGGQRPSRSAMEGQHGTKAEAGIHTDTGVKSAEVDDDDLAQQLQPVVDALLTLNFGPGAAGTVYIDPPPLVDTKVERSMKLIDAITKPGNVAAALAKIIDGVQLVKDLDGPVLPNAKWEVPEPQPPQSVPGNPAGNGTPMNGNGKPMNRVERAAASVLKQRQATASRLNGN
jgi:hypothetical protein